MSNNYANFEPIWIAENLCVCLDGVPPPPDGAVIRLRQSAVFGTGGHPATRAVLNQLIHRKVEGLRVVDFKCGTGLLGIFCSFFGAIHVVHMDDDPRAIREAVENGMLNECVVAFSQENTPEGIDSVDLIVTSQGRLEILKEDIKLVHNLLSPGGVIIWAGHEAKEHRVAENILGEFFVIETVEDINCWPVIVARK